MTWPRAFDPGDPAKATCWCGRPIRLIVAINRQDHWRHAPKRRHLT